MEDIRKMIGQALWDPADDNEDWDEETKTNWQEKMNEPIGYKIISKGEKEKAHETGSKVTA